MYPGRLKYSARKLCAPVMETGAAVLRLRYSLRPSWQVGFHLRVFHRLHGFFSKWTCEPHFLFFVLDLAAGFSVCFLFKLGDSLAHQFRKLADALSDRLVLIIVEHKRNAAINRKAHNFIIKWDYDRYFMPQTFSNPFRRNGDAFIEAVHYKDYFITLQ